MSTTRNSVILALGTTELRTEFLDSLAVASDSTVDVAGAGPSAAPKPARWVVRRNWADCLPPVRWYRFDVVKVTGAVLSSTCMNVRVFMGWRMTSLSRECPSL